MNRIYSKGTVLLGCLAGLGMLVLLPATSHAQDCDRACLKTMLDRYLTAVTTHDPSAAPLAVGFRQTENAVVTKLGTGAWTSVTGLGSLQRRYLDPVSGQAAYFGVVNEGNGSAIVTVRVKVERRQIAEAEWYMARQGDPGLNGPQVPGQPAGNFFDPDNLTKNPPPDRTLPKNERLSREALIGITNSYFDGITTHDGSIIMAHQGCARTENGLTVTGRATGPGARGGTTAAAGREGGAAPAGRGGVSDCTSGLETINIQLVSARRYPVVDEDAGVVLALAVFIRKPGTTTRRNVFSEWFVIDNQKIKSIYSAMFYPAPEVPVPNWPPYDGNWPLSPTLAPPPPPRQ
ncbi:MAG TPA: hypothetical protein VH436_33290 [Vicinamibacterales bacterium]